MAQIAILERKCNGCRQCISSCPFSAIEWTEGKPQLNAGCRVCGLCLKACPQQAIIKLETKVDSVDKTQWNDILVFIELSRGALHPVSLELIGKAHELAKGTQHKVHAVVLGHALTSCIQKLQHYSLSDVYAYEDPALSFFRADVFAACLEDCITRSKPSVVLIGATSLGRSLAPRISTRFHTGLTADCTQLALRENSDLVQIRPAFGGNIMAQIITPFTRPQFATVRYKVMPTPAQSERPSGKVIRLPVPQRGYDSPVQHIATQPIPKAANISDAEVIVVGGRGLQKEADLSLIKTLANLLHGEYAVTRPLVEKGWASNQRQIGLSGRTVRPKLIITCGISGAIQFTACMNASERIIAINEDPDAPIFQIAHIGIVANLYDVLPKLITLLQEENGHEAFSQGM